MSKGNRVEETGRWFMQAKYDMKAANWNLKGGFYNQVCFLSQQAAEKSLKSVIFYSGLSRKKVLSHSVLDLTQKCLKIIPKLKDLLDAARELDLHYIPARYPNGLASGYPHRFYSKSVAEKALSYAESFLSTVEQYYITQGILPFEEEE